MQRICFSMILLSVCLGGCMVGPDYKRPPAPLPKQFSSTTQPTTPEAQLAHWWKVLNDPLLDRLIDRALQNNLQLRQAEARVRQARAERGIVNSSLWPNANATAGYSRSRSNGLNGNGAEFDNFRAGLDASWEIDLFGQNRRAVESSDAQIQASMEDRRDVMISLLGEVALRYNDLRLQQERIDIARRNLQQQERTLSVIRRQVEGGFATSLDLANAQTQAASTRSLVPSIQILVDQDIHALSVLLGLPPMDLMDELSTPTKTVSMAPLVPVGLPSELLRRRPDIRRAEAQLHAQTAQIGVAVADRFPKFSLTGDIGVSSNRIAGLGNWSNRTWSIGPGVTWNIFSAGRVQSNIEAQEASRDQFALAYQQAILVALQDVEDSLVAYAREQEHLQSLGEALAASRRAVDVAEKLYANGQVDFLNVTTAQRVLLSAEDSYSQSNRAIIASLINLYKALGGGWETIEATTRPARE